MDEKSNICISKKMKRDKKQNDQLKGYIRLPILGTNAEKTNLNQSLKKFSKFLSGLKNDAF